jgi:hypothetical protein
MWLVYRCFLPKAKNVSRCLATSAGASVGLRVIDIA